jgi:hypothetical protein
VGGEVGAQLGRPSEGAGEAGPIPLDVLLQLVLLLTFLLMVIRNGFALK